MATDRALLVRVAARVREEVARLDRVAGLLRDGLARYRAGPQEVVVVHGVGGLVHDFYTGTEKALAQVSPDLNGLTPAGESWHRELLHTATLDLPGVRPPVLRAAIEPRLVELLKFRHLYRNLYAFDLRWDRVRELAGDALALWPDLRADLEGFASAIESLAAAAD